MTPHTLLKVLVPRANRKNFLSLRRRGYQFDHTPEEHVLSYGIPDITVVELQLMKIQLWP